MLQEVLKLKKHRVAAAAFIAVYGWLFLSIAVPSASALPIPKGNVHAIPAFARKYGMPCSSCHEAWPKLSPFGQQFKDNGYQMGNEKDAPIYQNPSYWPVSFRITPHWHRESVDHADITNPLPTGVTLLGSSWLNIKAGKFELDNIISEKRILGLSNNGGFYQMYHFQPVGEDTAMFTFGLGDNQFGAELSGHSKNDYTRFSAALLSSNDGTENLPNGHGYDTFVTLSQAFEAGSLGLQRVGAFAYVGRAPTYTVGGELGTDGLGQKSFYRAGFNGLWYIKKFDVMTQYLHGLDNALLGTATPSYNPLPAGAHSPTWNAGLIEPHYNLNPQFILIGRYELIRMSRQALDTNAGNLGDIDAGTVGFRYYPFISSRAGFAFHNEFSVVRQRGVSTSGRDLTSSSVFLGLDFIF